MRGVVSGVTGAAPIWHELMAHLLNEKPAQWPPKPAEVVGKTVCSTSGLLPGNSGCPTRFEYFIKGMEPKKVDPGKQKVFIDKGTNDLAKPGQTDNVEEREEYVVTDPTGARYCASCPHPEPSPTP
jgi:membrane carboxypeptidase/penicillin-binding protein